jgi:EAL domain-containing protein (putative c-di-GMP-specific phosphodiesterase class I)
VQLVHAFAKDATDRIVAAEALARWRHPELGLISPAIFIPIAEETALIHSLGRFMIDEVLTTVAGWRSAGIDLEVSVNVSATQLTTLQFFDRLDADLASLDLAPNAVTIEITESHPVLDTPSITRRLEELRMRGLGISIDDYGVGHSSLRQLERMPATELKIDLSLVQDASVESLALMTAVVELAHWRGLRVVAEGVETEEQLERVRELECDRAQGYLLGRPMPQEELVALVR